MTQLNKKSTTTSFMGVVINEKGSTNPMIIKALAYPGSLPIDIVKFVEITEFKLNMVMFDYFWQVMVGDAGLVCRCKKIDFLFQN